MTKFGSRTVHHCAWANRGKGNCRMTNGFCKAHNVYCKDCGLWRLKNQQCEGCNPSQLANRSQDAGPSNKKKRDEGEKEWWDKTKKVDDGNGEGASVGKNNGKGKGKA